MTVFAFIVFPFVSGVETFIAGNIVDVNLFVQKYSVDILFT